MSVIHLNAYQEGNAYLRLGEGLVQLGRENEVCVAYETGSVQTKKFGHRVAWPRTCEGP